MTTDSTEVDRAAAQELQEFSRIYCGRFGDTWSMEVMEFYNTNVAAIIAGHMKPERMSMRYAKQFSENIRADLDALLLAAKRVGVEHRHFIRTAAPPRDDQSAGETKEKKK